MVPPEAPSAKGLDTPQPSRAQTATIGIILVFGMVLAGSILIVVFGTDAITQTEDGLSLERAEKSLTQFDSKAALVALENAETQHVDFPSSGGESFEVQDTGTLTITQTDLDTLSTSTLFQQDLGTMVYQQGETTLAYQGGGVWRKQGDSEGSVMISPPEFHYRDGTLTLPVIAISGGSSISGDPSVTANGSTTIFPDAVNGSTNPLLDKEIEVTITSEYYKAWGQYFEDRTDGEVIYDPANNNVTLELVSPIGQQRITAATASLAASGEFDIRGNAFSGCSNDEDNEHPNNNQEMYANSYNSSGTADGYCVQAGNDAYGHDGDIVYGDEVDISGGSGGDWIHGDVVSGGNVTVGSGSGQPGVYGHINYTESCINNCTDKVEDPNSSVNKIQGVPKAEQINGYIQRTVEDIESDNDNAGAPITSGTLDFGASSQVTLSPGRYFLKKIKPGSGEEIILNTTNGDVIIGVRGDLTLPSQSKITVVGDGVGKIFLQDQAGVGDGDEALEMDQESEIRNAGDDAPQFRLYGRDDMDARLGDGSASAGPARFVGVIYAPPGNNGTGSVEFHKGEIFGGILTGTTIIESAGGSLHYDEALAHTQIINPGANVIKVTYLHISVNRIRIDD